MPRPARPRMRGLKRLLLAASLAALSSAPSRAADVSDFYGTWERVGENCASSNAQTEGDWLAIGRDAIAYGGGGVCSDVVMKMTGDRLAVTAHCVFEDSNVSTPMAEQLTLDKGILWRSLPERAQKYERCVEGEDGLSDFAPVDERVRCSPKDNTARILSEPSPNALHPNWSDGFLGTSFTIALTRRVKAISGEYLEGDLYTPRGNLTERGVFAVASEWDCSGQ